MLKKGMAMLLAVILAMGSGVALAAEGAWICPTCGEENSGNFCANCGTARPAVTALTECPNCHAELDPENPVNFCYNCGYDLRDAVASVSGGASEATGEAESDDVTGLAWDGADLPETEPKDTTPIGDQILLSAILEAGGSSAEVLRGSVMVPDGGNSALARISLIDGETSEDYGLYVDESLIAILLGRNGDGTWSRLEDGSGNAVSLQSILDLLNSQSQLLSESSPLITEAAEAVGKIIQSNLPLLNLEQNFKTFQNGSMVLEISSGEMKQFLEAVLNGIAADSTVNRAMTELNSGSASLGMSPEGWTEALQAVKGIYDGWDEYPFTIRAAVSEKTMTLTVTDTGSGQVVGADLTVSMPFSYFLRNLDSLQYAPRRASLRVYTMDENGFRDEQMDLSLTIDSYYTALGAMNGIRYLLDGRLSTGKIFRAEWRTEFEKESNSRTYSAEVTLDSLTIFRGSLTWTQTAEGVSAALHIDQVNPNPSRVSWRPVIYDLDVIFSMSRRSDGLDGSLIASQSGEQLLALALTAVPVDNGVTATLTVDGSLIGGAAGTYTLNATAESDDHYIYRISGGDEAQGAMILDITHEKLTAEEWVVPEPAGAIPISIN